MCSVPVHWTFTDSVRPARAAALVAWDGFDIVLAGLLPRPIVAFDWERAYSANLPNCHRASFQLRVPRKLYDAFFNSPVGYRGQYARSETAGELANRKTIDAFEPSLLHFSRRSPKATRDSIVKSLHGRQAKVWIVESEVGNQLQAEVPSIVYPPWEFNEPNGQGLRAPVGVLLEIKGGWLDTNSEAQIDPTKVHRSSYIYKTGDSK